MQKDNEEHKYDNEKMSVSELKSVNENDNSVKSNVKLKNENGNGNKDNDGSVNDNVDNIKEHGKPLKGNEDSSKSIKKADNDNGELSGKNMKVDKYENKEYKELVQVLYENLKVSFSKKYAKKMMNRYILTFFSLTINISLCIAQPLATKMDEAMKKYTAQNYSGNVLVYSNGEKIYDKALGFADRENKRPQTTETFFSIGSITKQFTAAGILLLEQQGKLSVNDKMSKYFDNVPSDKADITLHKLLTHTEGFTETLGDDYDTINAAQFATLALASKLKQNAGTNYLYSNVGYSMLGIIIEKVSGMGYEKFLHDNIFVPCKMNNTG